MNGHALAEKLEVEQAIRRSHCAMKDRQHECAGTCTITPSGIQLSCTLCGGDDRTVGPSRYLSGAVEQAKRILSRAGLDFDYLSAERQAEVTWAVQEAARELGKKGNQ